jgi:prepilin-type processing-associated H-X9-DG protein
MKDISRVHDLQGQAAGKGMAQRAFTLIELLVIIAVVATLAALLLPTLARARASAAKAECAANLRQLGGAITLFTGDHSGMYPPAGDSPLSGSIEISWDDYINIYISGCHFTSRQYEQFQDYNGIPKALTPGVLRCPADTGPDTYWVAMQEYTNPLGRRTYAMNVSSVVWQVGWQIPVSLVGYRLPTALQGVGVYWDEDTNNVWSAPSLKTSVVLQPANLILLTENACGDNVANNLWPCFCMAPYSTDNGQGNGELCQVSPYDPNNQGAALYGSHGNTFNYLFCDNHVSALTMQATVGNGTITNGAFCANGVVGPRGYWINNTNYTAN